MKNVIYTCYKKPHDKNLPGFVELHKKLAKEYAEKYNCDYICISDIKEDYKPLSFVVYEAYKHFSESNYDKMLYIDWDILISKNAPNIFEEYKNAPFAAYRWRDSYTNNYINISSIENFISHVYDEKIHSKIEGAPCDEAEAFIYFLKYVCNENVTNNILETYINEECSGGVMLFDKKTMCNFLYSGKWSWSNLYKKLLELNNSISDNNEIKMLQSVEITQSKYIIDYLRIINNINFDYNLNKKWNSSSVLGDMSASDYFFNFNGACADDSKKNILYQKDVACMRFVKNNKLLFFDEEKDFLKYIKNNFDNKRLIEIYAK